jgi:hypothetical protein
MSDGADLRRAEYIKRIRERMLSQLSDKLPDVLKQAIVNRKLDMELGPTWRHAVDPTGREPVQDIAATVIVIDEDESLSDRLHKLGYHELGLGEYEY